MSKAINQKVPDALVYDRAVYSLGRAKEDQGKNTTFRAVSSPEHARAVMLEGGPSVHQCATALLSNILRREHRYILPLEQCAEWIDKAISSVEG